MQSYFIIYTLQIAYDHNSMLIHVNFGLTSALKLSNLSKQVQNPKQVQQQEPVEPPVVTPVDRRLRIHIPLLSFHLFVLVFASMGELHTIWRSFLKVHCFPSIYGLLHLQDHLQDHPYIQLITPYHNICFASLNFLGYDFYYASSSCFIFAYAHAIQA